MRVLRIGISTLAVFLLSAWFLAGSARAQTCTAPGVCGGQTASGCFCDNRCLQPGFQDCCSDVLTACKVPVISTLAPTTGSTAGGYTATVTGNNFDNSNTAGTSVVTTVTIGGQSCQLGARSTTSLGCAVPEGSGRNHNVTVTTTWTTYLGVQTLTGTSPTAATRFSYSPPQLSALVPSPMPTIGGTLTISGSSLGASGASVTVAGASCPVTSQTHTQVQCTMAAGTGTNRSVVLTVGGQTSNALAINYAPPGISGFGGPRGTAGGTALTITGANFGPPSAVLTVTVHGAACPVSSHDQTQITCTLPAGQGSVPVVVTVGGQSSPAASFTYNAPTVSSVTPTVLPTTGGTLTIQGSDFGTSGTVTIDGASCAVTSHAQTQVVCSAPAGVGVGHVVTLTVSGQSASGSVSYAAPTLSSLSASSRPTQGGATVTLAGTNLGASGASVSIGGLNCPVSSQTHAQVRCTLPEGQGTGLPVVLTVGGQASNSLLFAYDAPQITGLSPAVAPTSGGSLTIDGANFGVFGATVTVAGADCPVIGGSHTTIACLAPEGVGLDQPVVVTVAGQVSAPALLDREAPSLSSMSPDHGPMAGGTVLTFSGTNFGASGATITVGGSACPVISNSHTYAKCTLPSGSGKDLPVVLSVGGQSSNSLLFDYDAPAIAAAPATLAFGAVLIGGQGGDATLHVSNPGEVELQVSSIDMSGAAAAEYAVLAPALPFTVAPGASQAVSVHFAPTAHGSRNASLIVHSNAVGQPSTNVALTGSGVAPVLNAGASVAFGSSNVGVALTRTVNVANPGERDLVVSQVSLSGADAGDFAVLTGLPLTVVPGGSAAISVRFQPTTVGARSAGASIVGNDPLHPVAPVALTGTGTSPALSLAPTSVDFGDVRIDESSGPLPVTVRNSGSGPLTITGVALGGAGAADFDLVAITLPFLIPPAGELVLQVSYAPAAVGADAATLLITSDDPIASSIEVTLTGNGVSPVFSLTPTSIDFGGQLVGRASSARRATIRNDGTTTLSVSGLTLVGPDAAAFSITAPTLPVSVAPGASLELPVIFTPATVGGASAMLSIATDDPAAPAGDLTLAGVGLSHVLAASPLAIDFGVIEAPGAAGNVALTVTNTSAETITLLDGALTGVSSAAFSVGALAGELAPGASRMVAVGFTGSAAGTYTAQLTITAAESGLPQVVVPLSARAVSSLLAVAPESLDFGSLEVGTSSEERTVTVTNQSGASVTIDALVVADTEFAVSGATPPITLAPGTSVEVQVSFTPSAAGLLSSKLEVHISGQTLPEMVVSLRGEGTAPPAPDAGPGEPDAGSGSPDAGTGLGEAGGGGCGCRVGRGARPEPWFLGAGLWLGFVWMTRRRRR